MNRYRAGDIVDAKSCCASGIDIARIGANCSGCRFNPKLAAAIRRPSRTGVSTYGGWQICLSASTKGAT
jgi:hypothetical protein